MEKFEDLDGALFSKIDQEELIAIRGGVSEKTVWTITTWHFEITDGANDPAS